MDDHDELLEQATQMAKGKKTPDLARMAFEYSYVANHELRMFGEKLGSLTKLVWGILLAIVLTVGSAVVGVLFKFLTG